MKIKRKRTIITMYGKITYNRTIYSDKNNGTCYIYVDRKFGIDKYIHYTSDVASYAYEAYCDENSMIKVGKELGSLIHGKYKLDKNSDYGLSRQTIRNLLFRIKTPARISYTSKKKEVSTLYLLLDEKYIPSQSRYKNGHNDGKFMNKVALIVEELDKKKSKGNFFINPYYYCSYSDNFTQEITEIIKEKYDLDKLEYLNIMSDSGKWCKELKNNLQETNIKIIEYTDKFHVFKTLWSLTLDSNEYLKAVSYVLSNDKEQLTKLLDSINIVENKIEKKNYILDNWNSIQNMVNLKNMNCAMEQVISHHVASQFTSVAKAYSKEHIKFYNSMRDNYRNNENMKEIYLKALDRKDLNSKINEEEYDFSKYHNILKDITFSKLEEVSIKDTSTTF